MIKFLGANKKLVSELFVLISRYPNDVIIEESKASPYLKDIIISNGIPVILKYYCYDNQFRLEIGSYLSNTISNIDYISIEIVYEVNI